VAAKQLTQDNQDKVKQQAAMLEQIPVVAAAVAMLLQLHIKTAARA
jgi:hypothetical protein